MNQAYIKNIKQISLITTYRCNAKCRMCNIWQYPTKPSEEIDPMYYEKIPNGIRVNITGGEPTIREDIDDIFKILYPKSSLLELSTNGYYTEKIVRLAEKYPKILIRVSIEGLPTINDSTRGLLNGFDRALRTILELKKTKCENIGFSVVISPENIHDLLSVYDLASSLGVELGNSVIHNSWYFHKSDNVISGDNTVGLVESEFIKSLLKSKRIGLKNRLKDYGRAYFNKSILNRLDGTRKGYRPPCGAGTSFLFVDPCGNVIPCNGSDEKWIMGNIKDSSLQEIMNNDKTRLIMSKIETCNKECCFIVTERQDMRYRPWKPIWWIFKNKTKLALNLPVRFN